jgi:cobalt-zinc-cadmium efflux system protein
MNPKEETHDHHGHHHHHHHTKMAYDRAFMIAISANGLYVILQIVFAYLTHSTSLLADAFHNMGDVLSLALAWIASHLVKRKPTERTTYGLKKSSILAALMNGVLLVFTCGIIATEAMYQFVSPQPIQAIPVIIVAGLGIFINSITALLFLRGSDDLNIRGAYLHLLSDALVSVGVVLSSALLYWTGWLWIDPLVGIIIALVILKGTWSLFADSLRLIIDGVPRNISLSAVNEFFLAKPGVKGIHDLHVWAMSTNENALSVHLYIPKSSLTDEIRAEWVKHLNQEFNIQHVTIQVEDTETNCHEACHTSFS